MINDTFLILVKVNVKPFTLRCEQLFFECYSRTIELFY